VRTLAKTKKKLAEFMVETAWEIRIPGGNQRKPVVKREGEGAISLTCSKKRGEGRCKVLLLVHKTSEPVVSMNIAHQGWKPVGKEVTGAEIDGIYFYIYSLEYKKRPIKEIENIVFVYLTSSHRSFGNHLRRENFAFFEHVIGTRKRRKPWFLKGPK
jgi:hypothetical protein